MARRVVRLAFVRTVSGQPRPKARIAGSEWITGHKAKRPLGSGRCFLWSLPTDGREIKQTVADFRTLSACPGAPMRFSGRTSVWRSASRPCSSSWRCSAAPRCGWPSSLTWARACWWSSTVFACSAWFGGDDSRGRACSSRRATFFLDEPEPTTSSQARTTPLATTPQRAAAVLSPCRCLPR
jgi:hypothetical protein